MLDDGYWILDNGFLIFDLDFSSQPHSFRVGHLEKELMKLKDFLQNYLVI